MSNLFKDIYSASFYNTFSETLALTIPLFDKDEFIQLIFSDEFAGYELKQRMTHTAKVLHHFLSDDFVESSSTLKQLIENLRAAGMKEESIEYMFLPEYISMYGLDNYEHAISAFEVVTQFTSCEFAVRPFIIKYEEQMLAQMLQWTVHENNMVRRLASEGSRPRLPWAMALPSFKIDPAPILSILRNLKNDPCDIVRRSVANNLNDISKDNATTVIQLAREWHGQNKPIDALIKHACRTMLKQGVPEVLELFGFDSRDIELSNFKILTPTVYIGDQLAFSFTIVNTGKKTQMLRLEYGLYYKKNNGELSKKVFKISEREVEPNRMYEIKRKQNFKIITTRKFYTGAHELSIIFNGQESNRLSFDLLMPNVET
ncbi:DNA alkylation repair protein [Vibrio sp. DW001]|uniref:DNA alkylation repair protein n=1 Tax=Vibrio sp. DW001 TaxID=2912315 RepID=UPI0023B01C4D|nr:DNA alkylation repair protein [Vibrio sp. DW001]WED27577.1 DNA alkylation repair protein [Vibrio sp. DW001]